MQQALRRGERLVIAIAGELKMQNGFVNDHDRDELAQRPRSGDLPGCRGPHDFPAVQHAQAKAGAPKCAEAGGEAAQRSASADPLPGVVGWETIERPALIFS